jgi:hypothetical protein
MNHPYDHDQTSAKESDDIKPRIIPVQKPKAPANAPAYDLFTNH